ncbi:unnamed protein product [Arctia plantaginis]|uniref:Uncharacterized protein n=1 Tax=Arctia plantaginis TaxID=874455 RepID=A0A8S0ZSR2_ARCPL|nr:unnamed protein product [Arctia plantaginis]
MKTSMVILVLAIIVACAVVSTYACPDSKFFKGTCNALNQDCQHHCTNLEGAKSGQLSALLNHTTEITSNTNNEDFNGNPCLGHHRRLRRGLYLRRLSRLQVLQGHLQCPHPELPVPLHQSGGS